MKRCGLFLLFVLILSACAAPAATSTPVPPTATAQPVDTPVPPTPTEPPVTPTAEPAQILPTATQISAVLDPAPQALKFQSSGDQELSGTYYPAAQLSAPLIVLMHWAPGDQGEWTAIAPWLQNRGLAKKSGAQSWKDPAWFPALPEGSSYAVFTFTFRGCKGGCKDFTYADWLKDARAAMEFAVSLPGVDPQRVVAIGASIGADGALDGCLWLNRQGSGRCLGAISFSPGDYLGLPYGVTATNLMELGFPAWCFYAEGDTPAADACRAAQGDIYQMFGYSGSDHGMMLLRQPIDPNPLDKIVEFLDLYLK